MLNKIIVFNLLFTTLNIITYYPQIQAMFKPSTQEYFFGRNQQEENSRCSICLENLDVISQCITLNCIRENKIHEHVYHAQCLKVWAETMLANNCKPTCPIDRTTTLSYTILKEMGISSTLLKKYPNLINYLRNIPNSIVQQAISIPQALLWAMCYMYKHPESILDTVAEMHDLN